MREIIFRGKTQHPCGNWIYGSLLTNYPCCKNEVDETVKEYYIIDGKAKELKMVQVIPETVGQYTGLTDKNGKKIFEGDIIEGLFRYSSPVNSVVCFRDGVFGLLWYRDEVEIFWGFTSICNVEYEVIGNIHDNPELLKGGD